MRKLVFAFLAIALALVSMIVALPSEPALANPGTIYVSTSGNDSTGDGSAGNPYRTIGKGISMAVIGDTVSVDAGTYSENMAMQSGVVIQGTGADDTTIKGGVRFCLGLWLESRMSSKLSSRNVREY
jgi:hypothetical protein